MSVWRNTIQGHQNRRLTPIFATAAYVKGPAAPQSPSDRPTPIKAVQFTKGEPKYYKSSPFAERGFCSNCGSSLTFRPLLAARNAGLGKLDLDLHWESGQSGAQCPHLAFGCGKPDAVARYTTRAQANTLRRIPLTLSKLGQRSICPSLKPVFDVGFARASSRHGMLVTVSGRRRRPNNPVQGFPSFARRRAGRHTCPASARPRKGRS